MCQARVLLDGNEIMEDVVFVEFAEEGVFLSRFFEEPVLVPAAVRSIDFLRHTVNLESDSETHDI
jgi:predicted RNA-binding protein